MNILITGANGQLGNSIRRISKGSAHRFIFTDVSSQEGVETVFLDITDKQAVSLVVESENVDLIINCAAYTNVDKAETDEELANTLNCIAPRNLAEAAREHGCALIHISTDYVFDGQGCTPIKPGDKPSPRSAYGRTKLAGERAVADSGCPYVIVRTAWLYSEYGKNFLKTMLHLTEVNDTVKVVYDQVGSPTYAGDLAAAVLRIAGVWDRSKSVICHFTDQGAVSWYDFASEINDLAGHKCTVQACLSAEFPSKVERPHYSVLDKSSIVGEFGVEVPNWKHSLVKCLKNMQKWNTIEP